MPQFDFFSFSTQVFWILIGFFSFYFFILKYYLVKVAETLKLRKVLKKKKILKNFYLIDYHINNAISYDHILSLILKKK